MADLDIERIAKTLADNMENPTITKKVDGQPAKKMDIGALAKKAEGAQEKGQEKPAASGGKRPSFMPDLSGTPDRTPPEGASKNSQIDTATAISAVTILKQELAKVGCQLSDYQIKFNLNGIDINGVKVTTPNIDDLRKSIPEIEGDAKHKIASKVSSLAMRAIQKQLATRIQTELGLNTSAFEYENTDQAALSMAVTPEEPETGPEEIAGMMEPGLDDMLPPPGAEPTPEPAPVDMGEPAPTPEMAPEMAPMEPATPMPGMAPEPMPTGPAPAAPPM